MGRCRTTHRREDDLVAADDAVGPRVQRLHLVGVLEDVLRGRAVPCASASEAQDSLGVGEIIATRCEGRSRGAPGAAGRGPRRWRGAPLKSTTRRPPALRRPRSPRSTTRLTTGPTWHMYRVAQVGCARERREAQGGSRTRQESLGGHCSTRVWIDGTRESPRLHRVAARGSVAETRLSCRSYYEKPTGTHTETDAHPRPFHLRSSTRTSTTTKLGTNLPQRQRTRRTGVDDFVGRGCEWGLADEADGGDSKDDRKDGQRRSARVLSSRSTLRGAGDGRRWARAS